VFVLETDILLYYYRRIKQLKYWPHCRVVSGHRWHQTYWGRQQRRRNT